MEWRGVPVWYHGGMICTGETYKNVVKITFFQGCLVGRPFRTLQLPASKATPGGPSTFTKATRSMKLP